MAKLNDKHLYQPLDWNMPCRNRAEYTPRDQFSSKIMERNLAIPTDLPRAVPYGSPQGTYYCDSRPFFCHPQKYDQTLHAVKGYRDIKVENSLFSLDYYNNMDIFADEQYNGNMREELVQEAFSGNATCDVYDRKSMFYNNSKLFKYMN